MPSAAQALGCLDHDVVLAFVQGELSHEQRVAALAHLDGCRTCQALVAVLASEKDPAPPSLAEGEVISGRFRLGEPLGAGAMGKVFRAQDRTLGVDVALKLMPRDSSRDAAVAFRREVEVGRRITHRNVCRIYDAGSTERYDYITMELIDGSSLSQVIARDGVTLDRALEILLAVADGLGAAHAVGVVHRDLKPANILLERKTGRVVITDFGLAADLETKQSRRLVGTPSFWAPEQARGEPATPACDVYALGVLAYRLFTDREFTLSDDRALDEVPRRLRRVVARSVEPRPSDRYADARQAGAAFAKANGRSWRPLFVAVAVAVTLSFFLLSRRSASVAAATSPAPNVSAPTATTLAPDPTRAPEPVPEPLPSQTRVIVEPLPPVRPPEPLHPTARTPSRPAPSIAPMPSASSAVRPVASATDGDLLYRR